MAEHKYQAIDSDSEKYKLTAEDIKGEKKYRKMKKKANKKKGKAGKVLLCLLLIFALLLGGGAFFVNNYLNKLNYGDMEAEVDPNLDKEETFEFEGQAEADKGIMENLRDDVMWYDDKVFNVLLVGYDLGDIAEVYFPRSDSMILVSINTVKNTINMVSLSRASYVAVPGHGNKRLNTAHAYGGAAFLVDTIQQNYKIRVDRYATVDFSGFERIIDVLGGVDITMSAKEAKYTVLVNAPGTYHLNGAQALAYSRLRWIDSDRSRTGRQRNVLNALVNKFKSSSVSTIVSLMDEILPLVTTDFTKTELISHAAKIGQYFTMPIHEDIIPHKALPLTVRDDIEVLILNWPEETSYLHSILYPDMIPQSAEENK